MAAAPPHVSIGGHSSASQRAAAAEKMLAVREAEVQLMRQQLELAAREQALGARFQRLSMNGGEQLRQHELHRSSLSAEPQVPRAGGAGTRADLRGSDGWNGAGGLAVQAHSAAQTAAQGGLVAGSVSAHG